MPAVPFLLLSFAAAGAQPQGVLLDFTAAWCKPCQQMSPAIDRLKMQGYPIHKVDVDRQPGLAKKYGIKSIPSFVLVVNGREVNRIVGSTSQGQLKRLLAQIPTKPAPAAPKTKLVADAPKRGLLDGFKLKRKKKNTVPVIAVNDGGRKKKSGFLKNPFRKKESQEVQIDSPMFDQPTVRANNNGTLDADSRSNEPVSGVDDQLASSSVRIQVKDGEGINFGSGTVVESENGRTIILTCGHIFRDFGADAEIEVDVFTRSKVQRFNGKVLKYDIDADVGLIAIRTQTDLAVSKIALPETPIAQGDMVQSVGCGGGQNPSRQNLRITALNRYRGPDNIECTGVPDQGRSGGGLFNSEGNIVGVCIAADPKESRGLYAGLKAVHQVLNTAGLAYLYESTGAGDNANSAFEEVDHQLAQQDAQPPAEPAARRSKQLASNQLARTAAVAQALDQAGEAEVICIIRPLDDAQAASKVVIINRASAKFINYLNGEMKSQPQPTMARVEYDQPKTKRSRPKPTRLVRRIRSDEQQEPRRYLRSAASRAP